MVKQLGVIFDMDGVIIDNHHYHTRAWENFWDKHELNISDKQYADHINGKTNNDIMRYLFGSDISQARIDELAFDKEKMYRDLYKNDIQIAAGLDILLDLLKSSGFSLGVASAGPPENVSFALDKLHIRHYFDSVVDSSMVTQGKPHPEAYEKTLRKFALRPDQCLIFEDSYFGIQAAKSSGCLTVAIATTFTKEELKSSQADHIISSFTEMDPATIESLLETNNAKV